MATCGGTLIGPDLVLSAAHCGDRTNQELLVGAYRKDRIEGGATSRFCDEWIRHPQYNTSDGGIVHGYDFALCKLDRPVELDGNVVLELNDDPTVPAIGDDVTTIGMGELAFGLRPTPEFLQYVSEPPITNDQCDSIYSIFTVVDDQICIGDPTKTGGKGGCNGDSGGPAVVRRLQPDGSFADAVVGVVSFAVVDDENPQCGLPEQPVVYGRVSGRFDWIKEAACDDLDSVASFCGLPNEAPEEEPSCRSMLMHELEVTVQTSEFQSRYSARWILTGDAQPSRILMERIYFVKDHERVHTFCLFPNESYTWRISNLDVVGRYALSLNGAEFASGTGGFAPNIIKLFTTPSTLPSTDAPSLVPTTAPTETMAPTETKKISKKSKKTKGTKKSKKSKNGRRRVVRLLQSQ